MMATSTFPPETSLPPPALHQPPPPDISQAGSVLDPPKAVIYNKDGTQCMHIVKKESLDVPGNQCQSQNSECSAAKKVSAILSDPPIGSRKKKKKKSKRKGGATSLSQMLPPEYDDDDEDAEFYQEIVQPLPPPPPPLHSTKSSRTPPFASTKAPCITKSKENFEDCKSGAAGTDAKRKKKKKKKTSTAEPISQLANSRNDRTASANEATAGKVVPSANRAQSKTTPSHPTNAQTNGRSMLSSDDGFWQDKNCEERAKIREFWLQMGEIERRELVQVEKEAVLRKMKEQQKQSCSCAICGRKRNAIEEELEVLYDAYYEELETYANQHQNQLLPPSAQYRANAGSPPLPSSDVSPFGPPLTHPASQQHQHHRRNLNAPPHEVIRSQHCQLHSQPGHVHDTISDDDFEGSDYEDEEGEDDEDEDEDEEEEEEDEDDEEEDDDEECEGELSYDDEEEEEDASDATRLGRRNTPLKNSPNLTHHPSSNGGGNGGGSYFNFGNSLTVKGGILTVADDLLKNDSEKFLEMMERLAERRMRRDEEIAMEQEALAAGNGPNGATYQDEYDDEEEEEEDDDEEFEDEAEEDSMTEEQRLEEGRRMFQLFAARMFEQRVLTAYREKVAQERQQRLLDELEEETRLKQEREDAKNKMKEKKKDKKRALRQQKEEERLAREAARLAEETAQRVERERRADAERKRKEEERLRSEKERKQKDEERARKEEEKRRKTKQREHKERQEREVKEKEREEKERREKEERQEQAAKEERERERKAQEEKEQQEKEDLEKGFTPVARSDRRRSSASDRHQHLMQQAQAAAQTQPRAPHPLPLPPPLSQRLPPSIPRSAVSSVRDAHHHGLPPPPPKNVHMHHRERKRDQPSPSTAAPATSLAPSLISPAVSASASLFAHSPTSTNLQLNAPPNQGSRPAPPGGQSNPLASPTYQSQRPSVSSIAQQPSSQTAVASSSANVSQSLFSDPTSSRQGTKSSPQVSPVPIESNSKRPASANGNSAPGPIGRPPLVTGTGATLGGNLCNGTTGGLSLSASPTRGLFLGGGQGLGVNVTDGRPVSPPRANSIPQGGSLFRGGDPIRPPTSKAIVRPAPIGRPRGSTVGFEATGTSSSPTKGLDMFDPPTSPPPTGPPGFAMYGRSRESTSPTPPSDQAPASTIPGGSNFTVPTIPCTSAVGSTAIPSSSASAATATGSLFSSPSFFSGPPAPLLHHDHDHDLAHPHHPLYHTTPHSLGPPPSQDISMHLPHSFLPSFLSHPGMQFLPPQAQVPLPQSQSQSQSAAAAVPPPPPPAQQSQPQPLPPSHDASQRAPHSHPQGLGHNLSIAPSPFVSSTAGLWGPVGGFGIGMGLMRGAGGGGGFLGGVGTIQGEGMNSMMQQGGSNSVTGVGAVGESRRSSGMGFEKTVWH